MGAFSFMYANREFNMTKQQPSSKNASLSKASNAATQPHPAIWQLKTGTANKLGKYAEGGIDYQVTSDAERSSLFIAITLRRSAPSKPR
jgi:hypothetical protein